MNIPFHRPSLSKSGDGELDELAEVAGVLESGWLTTGPKTQELETEFRKLSGAPFAAAVSSCTAGLHVALAALQIGTGDEVITTPLTFCATVQAIELTGARPVLADVGADGNIDPAAVESLMNARTRAILPVRLGGLPCDFATLRNMAQKRGAFLVEDAAHADPLCGASDCDAAVYSFYATKNVTSAEGGMVTTRSKELDRRIRLLSLHGMARNPEAAQSWKYEVVESGFKYNLSDLQAAVGVAQLRRLPETKRALRKIASYYQSRFSEIEEIELPPGIDNPAHSCHLYSIRLNLDKLSLTRDQFIERLAALGVAASVHFIPIPLHRAFARLSSDPAREFPQALGLYQRLISLPIYGSLTAEQTKYVADAVTAIARDARR